MHALQTLTYNVSVQILKRIYTHKTKWEVRRFAIHMLYICIQKHTLLLRKSQSLWTSTLLPFASSPRWSDHYSTLVAHQDNQHTSRTSPPSPPWQQSALPIEKSTHRLPNYSKLRLTSEPESSLLVACSAEWWVEQFMRICYRDDRSSVICPTLNYELISNLIAGNLPCETASLIHWSFQGPVIDTIVSLSRD